MPTPPWAVAPGTPLTGPSPTPPPHTREVLAHQRESRALQRGQIARHLPVLIPPQLGQGSLVLFLRVQQLPQAVRVRRDTRLQLTPESLPELVLPFHNGAALVTEALLGGLELGRLVVGEAERLAQPGFALALELFAVLAHPASAPCVGGILRREYRSRREEQEQRDPFHLPSRSDVIGGTLRIEYGDLQSVAERVISWRERAGRKANPLENPEEALV